MKAIFRSLAVYNYRMWFFGALVSNIGTWMQGTAQSWVVLTHLTDNNAAAMGLTMAMQFAPPLLLVGLTGWVADRFPRRILLFITQSTMLTLATAIGILLITDVMTLPMMFGFALALGITAAFDSPSRQAFVTDVVSREYASNAVALNAASFNSARMIGPAVAGVLIVAVGSGWVFIINAATFLAMIFALSRMRPAEFIPRSMSSSARRLSDGFRYVAKRPDLLITFAMVFIMGALAMNFPIYASTMALEFGQGADGFGVLSSLVAIGSLSGALMAAQRDQARIRVVIVATGAFGIIALISSLMPTYWAYGVTLVFVGFFTVTTLTTANGYVQTSTDAAVRGRVMALYMAIMMGGMPLGAPVIGWVAAEFGPRTAITIGGVGGLVACGIGLSWVLASGRLHRAEGRRFRLTLDETRPLRVVAPEEFSDEVAGTTPIPLPGDEDEEPHPAPLRPRES